MIWLENFLVKLSKKLKDDDFLKAQDFFRLPHNSSEKILYHHIGCYAFTDNALSKFVKLPQSNLELQRNLEQMRAIENNIIIKVALSNSTPLGVDTNEDLIKIKKEMSSYGK